MMHISNTNTPYESGVETPQSEVMTPYSLNSNSESLSPNTPLPPLVRSTQVEVELSDDEVVNLISPENQLGILSVDDEPPRSPDPVARRLFAEPMESPGRPSNEDRHAMFIKINSHTEAWKNNKFQTVQWTINNYTEHCVTTLCRVMNDLVKDGSIMYYCFGKEIGPTCGTPHLQGYTRFPKKQRWLQKRIFLSLLAVDEHCCWASLHPADQGDVGMRAYCSKTRPQDNTPNEHFYEGGTIDKKRKRGSRTDLHDAMSWIHENAAKKTRLEIAAEFPAVFFKYNKAMDKLVDMVRMKSKDERINGIHIYWYFGVTAAGKSHAVHQACEVAKAAGKRVFRKSKVKWWCGMDADDIVVMDDFRKNWMPFSDLLTMMDKYEYRGEVKGGQCRVMANTFYITTPRHPAEMYGHLEDSVAQLLNRIYKRGNGQIVEFKRDQINPELRTQKCWSFEESTALAQRTMENYQQNNGGSGAQAPNFNMPFNLNNNGMMM